jgi:hypothetical protein
MQPAYRPPRDRDAFATIRGYVYQIDHTVERWLGLGEGHCLELERGEDIDLDRIGSALTAANAEEQARLLEQVKHREKNLTLRDPSALEALANAVEHLAANRGLELRFCYTTNAAIGREKLCPFPRRTPGITLWEQVRRRELPADQAGEALASLRQFLQLQARPEKVPNGVWTAFQAFLGGADAGFSGLVARFEWSTAGTPAVDYPRNLGAEILTRGLAANQAEAEALYERLFLHVLRLLCRPGLKRLTAADLRAQQTATVSATDHALVTMLRQCIEQTDRRVAVVEEAVATISEEVRLLAERAGVQGRFEVASTILDLSLPPPTQHLCERRETVDRLLQTIGGHTWTALYGGPGTGKSQLALLAANCGSCVRAWVRFNHSMRLDTACALLDAALAHLAGPRQHHARDRRVCGGVPQP